MTYREMLAEWFYTRYTQALACHFVHPQCIRHSATYRQSLTRCQRMSAGRQTCAHLPPKVGCSFGTSLQIRQSRC